MARNSNFVHMQIVVRSEAPDVFVAEIQIGTSRFIGNGSNAAVATMDAFRTLSQMTLGTTDESVQRAYEAVQ